MREGWSEERVLAWIRAQGVDARRASGPRGHDAALLPRLRGRPVVCVDQTIEGVHVASGTGARRFAAKAVARSVSDLAATAAHPRAVLLAIGAPPETAERRLRGLFAGARAAAREYGAELVGGDLAARSGPLALTVSALGEFRPRGLAPARHRARPGQLVLVTGPLGGSGRGRHLRIRPRLEEGRWLAARGATALMDVSDGLARDLTRLAASSGVRIDLEDVPVHPDARRAARESGLEPRQHALFDGEDHELVATLDPRAADRALARKGSLLPGLRYIGRVRRGTGLYLAGSDGGRLEPWDGRGGWVHGKRSRGAGR